MKFSKLLCAFLGVCACIYAVETKTWQQTYMADFERGSLTRLSLSSDGQLSLADLAQDSGGAIKGPARGDIFFGAGKDAEAIAGRLNAHGRFFVFVPKVAAAALGAGKDFPDAPQ